MNIFSNDSEDDASANYSCDMDDSDEPSLRNDEEGECEYNYEYSDDDSIDADADTGDSPNGDDDGISTGAKIELVSATDLVPEMNRRLQDVHEALGIPLEAGFSLLRTHRWSVQSLLQRYFDNPERCQKEAGVYKRCKDHGAVTTSTSMATRECSICMEDIDYQSLLAMKCGHEFCIDCWKDYLTNAIEEEGATCILTTCPGTCQEVITEKEVRIVASLDRQLLTKYQRYQLRSFVDSNDLARWCPGKGCDRVAHVVGCSTGFKFGLNNTMADLQFVMNCNCGEPGFCIPCGMEPHLPATCGQIQLWNEKNSNNSETANWITVNTKPCPKCGTRISKNGGCFHLKCPNCTHGFCWICLGTHHSHTCNGFNARDGDDTATRGKRGTNVEIAKSELERYLHYFQRYHGHDEGQKFIVNQIGRLLETSIGSCETDGMDGEAMVNLRNALKQANEQLLICRRVLKFTYVFGFYTFMDPTLKVQKECFEHHQGILERLTDNLSEICETKEVKEINIIDVANQARAIKEFIKNVLNYVNDGLQHTQ